MLETSAQIEPHSLVILRHGRVITAGWWAPYSAERPHLLYSLSKSFTSTAAGLAVAEGLIGLEDLVVDHFPEFSDISDPRVRSMRVRHIAAMASGHDYDTWDRAVAVDPGDPVHGFLLLPPQREPGTVFAYNQSATYTLAAIVQRATGRTLTQYLRPRLLDPLGIGPVGWQQHPAGRDLGFTGLHATTDAIARLGQLYLQRGSWDGRQILPAAWVDEATRRHVDNSGEPNPDWQQGYGFQFWMARHGYRGDGAYGQFCVVLPEQDLVIAMTSATVEMQSVLDAMWQHVLPAVGAAIGDAAADDALRDRLSRLALPPPAGLARRPDENGGRPGMAFAPFDGSCPQQPSLVGLDLTGVSDGWRVTLRESDASLTVPVGVGDWSVSEPHVAGRAVAVAACGGWSDSDQFRCDLIFLETPHRLVLTCRPSDATFRARWETVPLWPGRLSDMHAPRPLR